MAQWFAAKAEHPDALLFFRMGDFYELFFADAEAAAAALDIALSHRGEHDGDPDPDVRRPVPCRRSLSRPPDPPRLPRRRRRADGGPEDPRLQQDADPARGRPPDHPRHASPRKRCWKPAGPTCCWPWRSGQDSASVPPGSTSPPACSKPPRSLAADLPALLGRLEPAEILAPATLPLGDWADTPRPRDRRRRRRWSPAAGWPRRSAPPASMRSAPSPMPRRSPPRSPSITCAPPRRARCPAWRGRRRRGDAGVMAMDAATRASLEIHRARDGGVLHTLLAAVQAAR